MKNETERSGPWMVGYWGGKIYPFDVRPGDLSISEIAHALSNLCRFGGHSSRFYSVCEHSCHVSDLCPPGYRLMGLLHDMTEAVLVDVPRPIKYELPHYVETEDRAWIGMAEQFGLPSKIHPLVKAIDNQMLITERNQLFQQNENTRNWPCECNPAPIRIQCWPPEVARYQFLERFGHLTGESMVNSGGVLHPQGDYSDAGAKSEAAPCACKH